MHRGAGTEGVGNPYGSVAGSMLAAGRPGLGEHQLLSGVMSFPGFVRLSCRQK